MIVCPLCEHAQPAGEACDVCGRRLELAAGETAPVPALDELEPTLHAAAEAPAVPRLEGLEPTGLEPESFSPAGLAEPEPFPDLEPTGAAPVAVDVAPAPDLEPTAVAVPGDAPTPLPGIMLCRYCRTPALPSERRCGRCGMRLPVVAASAQEGEGAGPATVHLCSCGAPVTGSACPACGARVAGALDG